MFRNSWFPLQHVLVRNNDVLVNTCMNTGETLMSRCVCELYITEVYLNIFLYEKIVKFFNLFL